jgi:hypothetical protein
VTGWVWVRVEKQAVAGDDPGYSLYLPAHEGEIDSVLKRWHITSEADE